MNNPSTETQMLIRKPAAEVFEAFINPEVTTNFWFTKSSGNLQQGQQTEWYWEMYNVSATINVTEILPNKRIVFLWGEPARTVEITFKSLSDESTYIVIKESGYTETGEKLIDAIKDSTGGFTTVLDGLKAWLEYGIRLNLISDKFPKEISSH
ncbi:MAG TPA: SRPBCC family protein [Flavobacterium sp.]|jgi:uncharacterized protein YndB with AHSA1/START domain